MRPKKIEDLKTELRENIGYVDAGHFLDKPGLVKAWADFVQQLNRSGYFVVPDNYNKSRQNIDRPFTTKEKEQALLEAQSKWDRFEAIYDACCANGTVPESQWQAQQIKEWAKEEGVQIPWTEEDELHHYG